MKVSVVGTGYVGLVTGATLADLGNQVVCLDIAEEKINILNSGKSPIYEPGLDKLIQQGLKAKNLKGSTEIKQNIRNKLSKTLGFYLILANILCRILTLFKN